MNENLKNLNKKQFEKCLITLEMLTFATPEKYTDSHATISNGDFKASSSVYFWGFKCEHF